jgi:hypothetical protein
MVIKEKNMDQRLRKINDKIRLSESVLFNLDLLLYRINKLKALEPENQFEFLTYFDSALVQFRAMFLEFEKKNFTIQNFFRKHNRSDIASAIDDYLNQPFDYQDKESSESGNEFNMLREMIKFVTDKFICHYDKTNSLELGRVNYISATLSNPYHKRYLVNIIEEIINLIKEKSCL